MRLKRFEFKNLFGQYNPIINFTLIGEHDNKGSVTIIHGQNGVGKTTVLRAINGLLRLDFDIFRSIPFDECSLEFSSGRKITVRPERFKCPHILNVEFEESIVQLNEKQSGPVTVDNENIVSVERLRKSFIKHTYDISFELIDTDRYMSRQDPGSYNEPRRFSMETAQGRYIYSGNAAFRECPNTKPYDKSIPQEEKLFLANKVYNFINESQVYFETYFKDAGSDAFEKIIESLIHKTVLSKDVKALLQRMRTIKTNDLRDKQLGLSVDEWDHDKLANFLHGDPTSIEDHIYTVISSYLDVLESKSARRKQVAERLEKFQDVINNFFTGKIIRIDPRRGFTIVNSASEELLENQLSSGEYHLLYLFVSALTVKRMGTIIAIDEPELSMHISWSRNLVRNLLDCASGAETQFIFATHSPEIVAEFRPFMQEIN